MRLFIPLRFKILLSLLLGITVVVSVITFTMANLFHADKTTYIKNLISTNAIHIATETRSLIRSYVDRTRTFGRVAYDTRMTQDEKSAMLDDLFRDFTEIAAITFYENGVRHASVFDKQMFAEAGLTRADLDRIMGKDPAALAEIEPDRVVITNSTFRPELPIMTIITRLQVPGHDSVLTLEALVRTDHLIALMERSETFESFIFEADGQVLVHGDPGKIYEKETARWIPDVDSLVEQSSLAGTFDFTIDGEELMGGFARVEIGDLMAGVQIPKTAAYLSAQQLFDHLLIVSLIMLLGGAVISLVWSYRITRPLVRLTTATRDVGRGEFEIQLKPTSRDEIGSLTTSVNRMAFELREREKALAETQAALIQSEKMSAFGQLSAGIAHEVKNPLAGILGYVQLSLKKLKDNPSIRKNLTVIEKETRRCNAIIENLMKFARQDAPQLEPLVLNEVVEDSITLVDHQMGLSSIDLEKDLAESLPLVRGDANQLIQVFMNILINAQQAMDGSPGTVTISTASSSEDTVEIRITDTGPGMPDEVRTKIFEPFFTTKIAGKGTGLGLAVTYGIIKDHGGNIRVESEVGEGTTFIITLPVSTGFEEDEEDDLPVEAADEGPSPESEEREDAAS